MVNLKALERCQAKQQTTANMYMAHLPSKELFLRDFVADGCGVKAARPAITHTNKDLVKGGQCIDKQRATDGANNLQAAAAAAASMCLVTRCHPDTGRYVQQGM
jgi:hypothetical protein